MPLFYICSAVKPKFSAFSFSGLPLESVVMGTGLRGNKENMQLGSFSYVNAKLYKAFCNNRFSVSLEANDVFNKSNRDIMFYNKDVTLWQNSTSDNRALLLTVEYNFNTSRNRYKGKGAGTTEINRF